MPDQNPTVLFVETPPSLEKFQKSNLFFLNNLRFSSPHPARLAALPIEMRTLLQELRGILTESASKSSRSREIFSSEQGFAPVGQNGIVRTSSQASQYKHRQFWHGPILPSPRGQFANFSDVTVSNRGSAPRFETLAPPAWLRRLHGITGQHRGGEAGPISSTGVAKERQGQRPYLAGAVATG